MNHTLLREFVKQIVFEAIRMKKKDDEKKLERFKGDYKFVWNHFKELPDNDSMLEYAEYFLEELGKEKEEAGSSRKAFFFSGKKVLKIAKNDAGIAQNEAESQLDQTVRGRENLDLFTKVYQVDPEFKWILVDVAKTSAGSTQELDEKRFKEIVGVDWFTFKNVVKKHIKLDQLKLGPKTQNLLEAILELTSDTRGPGKLLLGDVLQLKHWGVTGDGRLVLIDFGFTADVKEKHYIQSPQGGWVVKDPRGQRAKKEKEILDKLRSFGDEAKNAGEQRGSPADDEPTRR